MENEQKEKIEYMVEVERTDGTTFGRKYFTDKQKAFEYAKALEIKYLYLVVHMIEI